MGNTARTVHTPASRRHDPATSALAESSIYRNDWKGVSPVCEIVVCEFEQVPKEPERAPEPTVPPAWDQLGLPGLSEETEDDKEVAHG